MPGRAWRPLFPSVVARLCRPAESWSMDLDRAGVRGHRGLVLLGLELPHHALGIDDQRAVGGPGLRVGQWAVAYLVTQPLERRVGPPEVLLQRGTVLVLLAPKVPDSRTEILQHRGVLGQKGGRRSRMVGLLFSPVDQGAGDTGGLPLGAAQCLDGSLVADPVDLQRPDVSPGVEACA